MLWLSELDRNAEGRHREHAAPLHSRSCRGARRLSGGAGPGPAIRDPRILALDAAGSAVSVAVTAGESLLALRSRDAWHGQAEALMPTVDAAMRESGLPVSALDLVAATVGPGSFTGIRAGLAAAQGIALAARLPLIGVTGFAAVAATDGDEGGDDGRLLLVAIESRRAELFVQLLLGGRAVGEPEAVPPDALGQWIAVRCGDRPLVIAGDAGRRAAAILAGRPRTDFAEPRTAIAAGVARAALARWRCGERGGAIRPLYLRSPAVTYPGRRDEGPVR